MMEMFGYASAVIIGLSLGLIGGGGSILTVPVLVYLFGLSPVMATAYSLFIVGLTSVVGGVRYALKGQVDYRAAVIFGIPSIAAVFLTRMFIVPAIPLTFDIAGFTLGRGVLLMVLFAVLMLLASYSMIKPGEAEPQQPPQRPRMSAKTVLFVLGEGLVVGTLTGLVGAGGGFLIIPALVMLTGLRMKTAIGTSLVIISAKSLIGFMGDISNYTIDWVFLFVVVALAVAGILAGSFLANRIDGQKLKVGFGWFTLGMAVLILLKEVVL